MATAKIKAPTGGVEKTVDEFGLGLLTATAVGIVGLKKSSSISSEWYTNR